MDAHATSTDTMMHLRAQLHGHAASPSLYVGAGYAPLAPVIVEQLVDTPHVSRQAVEPMRDPLIWTLVKHAALCAFVLMALLIVLHGDGDLMMATNYAGTAFLTIVTFVVADRVRFIATYGRPEDIPFEPIPAASGFAPLSGYDPAPVVPVTHMTPYHMPAPQTFQVNVT